MARHRRPRTVLATVAAVTAGWLTVLGTATAAPATPDPTGAIRPAGQAGHMSRQVSPQAVVPPGTYQIKPYLENHLCLRAGPEAGDTGVYVGGCDGATALWQFTPASAHGAEFMEVRNLFNGRCLNEFHLSGEKTGRADLLTCNQRATQAWDFRGGTFAYSWACVASSAPCDLVLRASGSLAPWMGRIVALARISPSEGSMNDRRWQLRPAS